MSSLDSMRLAEVKIRAPLTPVHFHQVVVLLPGLKFPLLSPTMRGVLPATLELTVIV